MTARSKERAGEPPFIWDRQEPKSRPAPSPLSRESIVRAAIELADKDGLASVSLRKVGASLEAGPMRLYGYLSTKEELLDLMVDVVYGEMLSTGPAHGDWRKAIRAIALRIRQAARRHPWVIDLLGGRPHFGPNALAYREEAFGALTASPDFDDIDVAMQALKVVNAYVIGAILSEASQLRSERESGLGEAEWQAASWPYIERMIATGRFPMLAKIVHDATHKPADVEFAEGLECVLDGIAARFRLSAPARS